MYLKPSIVHKMAWLILLISGVTKTSWTANSATNSINVITCYFDGVRVYALTFWYGLERGFLGYRVCIFLGCISTINIQMGAVLKLIMTI